MYLVGILALTDQALGDVSDFEQALDRQGYPVHLEQMGYNLQTAQVGDYYFDPDAVILWLCRCYGDRDRCHEGVERFIDIGVDLIVATSPLAFEVALTTTGGQSIPIVFTNMPYPPVEERIIELLKRSPPVTGVRDIWLDIAEERLALVTEIVPAPTTVHTFFNPDLPSSIAEVRTLEGAAERLDLRLISHQANGTEQVRALLNNLRTRHSHAIFRLADPAFSPAAGLMGSVAHEQYIPYIGLALGELERCNALFVLEVKGIGDQLAAIVVQILQGADVSDVPVADPSKKILGVNLQAAQDLGLVVSQAIQERADIIIPAKERTHLGARLLAILMAASLILTVIATAASQVGSLYVSALTLAAAVFLSLALWFYTIRSIIRPIQHLTFTAEKIGAGELDTAIGEVKVEDEISILARALRSMRSNLTNSYAELEKMTLNLEQRVDELANAYSTLQETQRNLELANRRIIEADDNSRFALTTYIHDEILGPLDDLAMIARDRGDPAITDLVVKVEQRIRRLRYDLSVPILRDVGVELRRLLYETLPQIFPSSRQVDLVLDIAALDESLELEPGCGFLLYRFVRGAVGNVYRHAMATRLAVKSEIGDRLLILSVSDDGCGFDPSLIEQYVQNGHYFFHDIQIRVSQLNGTFQVESRPGLGCHLQVTLPIKTSGR